MKIKICFAFVLLVAAVNAYHLDKEIAQRKNDPTSRIVNGEDVEVKSYYVRVSGYSKVSTKKDGSGTLITQRHVLTLASLIKGFYVWDIGYGSNVLNKLTNITSNFGFIHPLFDDFDNSDDIGIIILPNSLTTGGMVPVSLPDVLTTLPRDNEEGTIVGFQTKSNIAALEDDALLKGAYLEVISQAECGLTTNDRFCAANKLYQANVCGSDIGAAFTVNHRGTVLLAGMLTSANYWCDIGDRSFYLRVQNYVPWIRAVTNM